MSQTVWIFTPVYKDVECFLTLHKNITSILPSSNLKFVFIDDTSGLDPDVSQVKEKPNVSVLTCPFNLGHQRALVYGLRRNAEKIGDNDVVVSMDADGQDHPEDIPRLIEALNQANPQTIVLARRTKRKESLSFRVLYFFYKCMFYLLTGKTIRSGNFAIMRGLLLKKAIFHPLFDLCYSSSLLNLNFSVRFVDCERGDRTAGESKMNLYRLFIHGLRMLMPFMDRIAIRFAILFFLTFVLSMGAGLFLIGSHLAGGSLAPPWLLDHLVWVVTISIGSLSGFVILFILFSQSQVISMSKLDR